MLISFVLEKHIKIKNPWKVYDFPTTLWTPSYTETLKVYHMVNELVLITDSQDLYEQDRGLQILLERRNKVLLNKVLLWSPAVANARADDHKNEILKQLKAPTIAVLPTTCGWRDTYLQFPVHVCFPLTFPEVIFQFHLTLFAEKEQFSSCHLEF